MSKTTIRKGKQDDKYCLAIREIQNSNADNKKCLDCEQRGPTYINITIGSFVCTKCSGMLRGINPPHRIKSISMSSFTPEEVEMMKSRGNTWCAQVWLGTYNKAQKPIDFKDEEKIRDFIIEKYEKKRYYVDPSQISKPKVSPSTGSFQSAVPETRPLSQLIGTSLKSSLANSSQGNISISRPGGGPPPVIKPPSSEKAVSVEPSPSILGTTSSSSTSLSASSNAAVSSTPDAFANFANFDTAAFDSLPPGNLPRNGNLLAGVSRQEVNHNLPSIFCPATLPLSPYPSKSQSMSDILSLSNPRVLPQKLPPPPGAHSKHQQPPREAPPPASTASPPPTAQAPPSPLKNQPIFVPPRTQSIPLTPLQPRTNPYYTSNPLNKPVQDVYGPFKSHKPPALNLVTNTNTDIPASKLLRPPTPSTPKTQFTSFQPSSIADASPSSRYHKSMSSLPVSSQPPCSLSSSQGTFPRHSNATGSLPRTTRIPSQRDRTLSEASSIGSCSFNPFSVSFPAQLEETDTDDVSVTSSVFENVPVVKTNITNPQLTTLTDTSRVSNASCSAQPINNVITTNTSFHQVKPVAKPHQSAPLHSTSPENQAKPLQNRPQSHSNGHQSVSQNTLNPFLPLTSKPPPAVKNPFKVPLSSMTRPDPGDKSTEIGLDFFFELVN